MKPYVDPKGKAAFSLCWGDKRPRKHRRTFKKSARQQNKNTMSRGSRTGVRKRMIASAPRMPNPRARLLPMTMIIMHHVIDARIIACTNTRE